MAHFNVLATSSNRIDWADEGKRLMGARRVAAAVGLLSAALVLAGSGRDSGGDDGSSTQGAKARGPITFVTGKDNSGVVPFIADEWNTARRGEKVTTKQP